MPLKKVEFQDGLKQNKEGNISNSADPSDEGSQVLEWEDRIAEIRQRLVVSSKKNISFANFQIESDSDELIAVSGQNTRPGTVDLPEQPFFETFEVPAGHSRAYDSEYKLLEELASRYAQMPEAQGTVNLFTERPPCASCSSVIEQFRLRFPNIRLTVNQIVYG